MGPLAVSLVFFSILQYSIAQQYYQVNLNNRLDAQTTSNNADSQNLLDDNPNTIWQSIDEVDNINISLTPKQVRIIICLFGLTLYYYNYFLLAIMFSLEDCRVFISLK